MTGFYTLKRNLLASEYIRILLPLKLILLYAIQDLAMHSYLCSLPKLLPVVEYVIPVVQSPRLCESGGSQRVVIEI